MNRSLRFRIDRLGESMTRQLRAFIACDLPDGVIQQIETLQKSLKKQRLKLKWVRPESLHLTLKFLGNILPESVDPVGQAMQEAVREMTPFCLAAKGIGVFPGIKKARVVWVGLSGDVTQLGGLANGLETALETLGFAGEKRPFKAHLTIARAKVPPDPKILNQAVSQQAGFETDKFTVEAVHLFKSDLKPSGAVYTKLTSVPFLK